MCQKWSICLNSLALRCKHRSGYRSLSSPAFGWLIWPLMYISLISMCISFSLFDKWAILCYEVFVIKKYLIVKYQIVANFSSGIVHVDYSLQIGQLWPTVVINLYNLLVHLTTFYADTIKTKITTVNHHVPWCTTMYHGQSVL